MNSWQFLKWTLCEPGIGWITLNRPPVNALSRQMIRELNELLTFVAEQINERRVRVCILQAEGKHFCAGADLKERRQIPENRVEEVVSEIRDTFQRVAELPVPVIAALHGSVLGGGLELALAADWRIVAEDARLGLPETGLAIIPGAGGTQRLPRLIGYGRALYWITSAKIFSGREAFEQGVAEFLVKPAELKQTCEEMANAIARNGPVAVQAAKEAMRKGLETSLPGALEIEKVCYRRTITTRDRLEGLQAFAEKRPPRYSGE